MTSKNEETNVEETPKLDEATEERFNLFGQNLAAFELEVDNHTSSTLKKVLKIVTGYPLAMNAEELNASDALNDKEKSLARVACALKEQTINLFLEEQYKDLTAQQKETNNEQE